jgi:hypothetical protein
MTGMITNLDDDVRLRPGPRPVYPRVGTVNPPPRTSVSSVPNTEDGGITMRKLVTAAATALGLAAATTVLAAPRRLGSSTRQIVQPAGSSTMAQQT